jgi:hypothetical protein
MLCLADTQRTLLLVSKVLYKEIQLSAFIATLLLLREGSGFWEKGKGRKASDGERHGWLSF